MRTTDLILGVNFTKIHHNDTYPFIDPATKSDHTGHYVFITGASKGVGKATALAFAKAGTAGIAVAARSNLSNLEPEIQSAAKEAGKKPPKVIVIHLDVLDYDSVQKAAKQIEKEFGRLDILINNAGYLNAWKPLLEADPGDYWMNFEINLRGVYWVSKALLPLMLRGGEKTIVNVTSAGAHGISKGGSGYQNSKFAVVRFTEYLMADYGDQGILAYAVHPCGARTEVALNMPEDMYICKSYVFFDYSNVNANPKTDLTDTVEIASDTMCFLTAKRLEWLAGRYISCTWDMAEFLSREKEIIEGDKLRFRMTF